MLEDQVCYMDTDSCIYCVLRGATPRATPQAYEIPLDQELPYVCLTLVAKKSTSVNELLGDWADELCSQTAHADYMVGASMALQPNTYGHRVLAVKGSLFF